MRDNEHVGNMQLSVCEVSYVYVIRSTNGEIMARCEGVEKGRLVANLLNDYDRMPPGEQAELRRSWGM